jgi:hypothetical protein
MQYSPSRSITVDLALMIVACAFIVLGLVTTLI